MEDSDGLHVAREQLGKDCDGLMMTAIKVEQTEEMMTEFQVGPSAVFLPGSAHLGSWWGHPSSYVEPKLEFPLPCSVKQEMCGDPLQVDVKPRVTLLAPNESCDTPAIADIKAESQTALAYQRPSCVFLPPASSLIPYEFMPETLDLKPKEEFPVISPDQISAAGDLTLEASDMGVDEDVKPRVDLPQLGPETQAPDILEEIETKMEFEETWNKCPVDEPFPDLTSLFLSDNVNCDPADTSSHAPRPGRKSTCTSAARSSKKTSSRGSCERHQPQAGSTEPPTINTRSKKRKSDDLKENQTSALNCPKKQKAPKCQSPQKSTSGKQQQKHSNNTDECGNNSDSDASCDSQGKNIACNFSCHLCSKTYTDPKTFNDHIVKFHKKYLYCTKCKFLIKSSDKKLLEKHKSQCCTLSPKFAFSHLCEPLKDAHLEDWWDGTSSDTESDHFHKSESDEEIFKKSSYFVCHLCNITYTDVNIFNQHVSKLHKRYLYCNKCKILIKISNKIIYERHETQCCKLAPYPTKTVIKCNYCVKCFKNVTKMNDHKRLEHSDKLNSNKIVRNDENKKILSTSSTKCNFCSMCFENLIQLKSHVNTVHAAENANSDSKVLKNVAGPDKHPLKCDYCSLCFQFQYNLNNHIAVKHPEKINPNPSLEKASSNSASKSKSVKTLIKCNYCAKYYYNLTAVSTHIALEHPEKPNLNTILKGDTNASGKTIAELTTLIKCNYCPLYVNNLTTMNNHISKTHPEKCKLNTVSSSNTVNMSLLKCIYCPVYAKNITSMKIHVATMHPGKSNPDQVSNLNIAKMTLLKCNYCSLNVRNETAMKNHVAFVHPEMISKSVSNQSSSHTFYASNTTLVKCHYCALFVKNTSAMKSHVALKHPEISNSDPVSNTNMTLLKCNYCALYAKNTSAMNNHVAVKHPDIVSNSNPTSNYNPTTKQTESVSNKMLIQCNYCSVCVKNLPTMKDHIAIMHPEKLTNCSKVSKSDASTCSLQVTKSDSSTQICEGDLKPFTPLDLIKQALNIQLRKD